MSNAELRAIKAQLSKSKFVNCPRLDWTNKEQERASRGEALPKDVIDCVHEASICDMKVTLLKRRH